MTRFTVIPHRLFHRTWRSGHPFRPRLGRVRRVAMLLMLLSFSLIIGGYNYLTDSTRVRGMAQEYLSQLIGGKVEVRSATLSIFDGLRVDGIDVYVDPEGKKSPDSLIFTAQSFVLKYDPRQLLAGEIQASQIIAQKPRVYLTESLDHPGEWNFHRLGRGRPRRLRPSLSTDKQSIPLPEVLLRNARVDINEFHGDVLKNIGYMAIDGQLTPTGAGSHCLFEMQTRGNLGVGPYASGEITLATQEVHAEIHNFDFGRDPRLMMPAYVRDWLERHGVRGQVDIPDLSYTPAAGGDKARFRVDVRLQGMTLGVAPEDWMTESDLLKLRQASVTQPGAMVESTSIALQQGSGRFVFTEDGITLHDITGQVEDNAITLNGHIEGYGADAPLSLTIRSAEGRDIFIPRDPRWAAALPPVVRDIYQDVHPSGTCRVVMHIDRAAPGATPVVRGQVDLVDGSVNCRQFPYPVRRVSGTVTYGPDARRGGDVLKFSNVHFSGMQGGPNENAVITADGEIGPFGPGHAEPDVRVIVSSAGISSEPKLIAAYPEVIRHALSIFDADKKGEFPQYRGSFKTTLLHTAGGNWTYDTDAHLDDVSGRIVGFPYPLNHVAGNIQVRDGYVDIIDVGMRRGGVEISAAGRVVWGEGGVRVHRLAVAPIISLFARQAVAEPPEKMDLQIHVHGVPINSDLVSAIPAGHRAWIYKLGIGGTLDADGHLTLGILPGTALVGPARLVFPQWSSRPFGWKPEQINFDVPMELRNGAFWPQEGTFSVSDVAGRLHLTRDGMDLQSLRGKRGSSVLTADGKVTWGGGRPEISIHATGKDLALDASLYAMLPEAARHAWDEVQPRGALDADVTWRGEAQNPGAENASEIGASAVLIKGVVGSTGVSGGAITTNAGTALPLTSRSSDLSTFYAVLRPAGLSCTIRSLPYRLDAIHGTVVVDGGQVTLSDITAWHGPAKITADGNGNLTGPRSIWDMRLSGTDVALDDEFRKSVPLALQTLIESLKIRGKIDFDLSRLLYRGEEAAPAAGVARAAGAAPLLPRERDLAAGEAFPFAGASFAIAAPPQPAKSNKADKSRKLPPIAPAPALGPVSAGGPDIALTGAVMFHDAALEAGVSIEKIQGRFALEALVRQGKVYKLAGDFDLPSLVLAGRKVSHFRAALSKPLGSSDLNLDNVQATVADGQLAGQLHLVLPDQGASRYTLGLVLRNADVNALVGDSQKDLKGDLTASVSLEGAWGETNMRHGRGDVTVTGRELYRMPLILGLLQVTNLALPIGSPFNQGIARYSVDGQRVNFERVELKSDNMLMAGGGYLDFGTKQVRMTFTTDNPGGFKIPFVNDLWQGARQELFKISIKGSIEQPKVEANPFGTVTTTIDEVFRGDSGKDK